MNGIVYVVTEGMYSDYHIVGICTNRELAEKVKKYYSGPHQYPDICEWMLDADIPEDISTMREYYRVYYYMDSGFDCELITKHGKLKDGISTTWNGPSYDRIVIDIPCDLAKDEDHALKIAKDRIAQLKATRMDI